ncbi:fasciclin domain-containing protein, partial [Escherichia coli]
LAADPAQLKAVLSYHVIAGSLASAEIKPGSVKTRQGSNLTIAKAGTFITADDAVVQQADVVATNGVAHIID